MGLILRASFNPHENMIETYALIGLLEINGVDYTHIPNADRAAISNGSETASVQNLTDSTNRVSQFLGVDRTYAKVFSLEVLAVVGLFRANRVSFNLNADAEVFTIRGKEYDAKEFFGQGMRAVADIIYANKAA